MINIAVAIGLAIGSLLSPGKRLLALLGDDPVLQGLPPYQGHLVLAFVSYLAPAVLAYGVLRLGHAERWLRPRAAIHALLGLANVLLVLYVAARTFAATIPGGGAGFAVAQLAPFVVFPAWALSAAGLLWLSARSIGLRHEATRATRRPWRTGETLGVMVSLGVPAAALAWTLFLSADAPFRLARDAAEAFRQRCATAGEKVYERPENVQSVYLEPDGGSYFENIRNGTYGGQGSGIIGESFVKKGLLAYFEKPNDRQRLDGSKAKYRRLAPGDWKGEPVDELASEFGVFQKSLVSNEERKLGLSGTEVTIKNLRSDQAVASVVFFTSSRHRAICGHSDSRRFAVSDFIRVALNLSEKPPTARSEGTAGRTPDPKAQGAAAR